MNSVRRFRCPKFGARVRGVRMHIYRGLPILYRPEIEIDDFFHNVGATQPPLSWCVQHGFARQLSTEWCQNTLISTQRIHSKEDAQIDRWRDEGIPNRYSLVYTNMHTYMHANMNSYIRTSKNAVGHAFHSHTSTRARMHLVLIGSDVDR